MYLKPEMKSVDLSTLITDDNSIKMQAWTNSWSNHWSNSWSKSWNNAYAAGWVAGWLAYA